MMLKKRKYLLILIFIFLFTGCSLSKKELREESLKINNEIERLEKESEKYEGIKDIFEFYNNITTENLSSFVVVESKNNINSKTKYSNGVVLGVNSLKYYILTDYDAIKQNGLVTYRVMDKNANVYEANIATANHSVNYDNYSGLVLLEVRTSVSSRPAMDSVELGVKSDLSASFSSVSQLNKVQLLENVKTSTVVYQDASYNVYGLENTTLDSGTVLINDSNQVYAMYMSKLDTFISINLIKELIYSTYSLVL